MEAEYLALTHEFPSIGTTTLHTDNMAASVAHDSQIHTRLKHIDIRHHFLHEGINSNDISFTHVASEYNVADLLMKALACPTHEHALFLLLFRC